MPQYDVVGLDAAGQAELLETLKQMPNREAMLAHARALLNSHPSLSTVTRPTLETRPTLTKRSTGGKKLAPRATRQDPTSKTFSGDGCNMRCGTSGGKPFLREQLWYAAVPSNGTPLMVAVIGSLDQQPGKYGTNTQHLRVPESFTGLVG